jgi:hypothetical protein
MKNVEYNSRWGINGKWPYMDLPTKKKESSNPLNGLCRKYLERELESYLHSDLLDLLSEGPSKFSNSYVVAGFDWVVEKWFRISKNSIFGDREKDTILCDKLLLYFSIMRDKFGLSIPRRSLHSNKMKTFHEHYDTSYDPQSMVYNLKYNFLLKSSKARLLDDNKHPLRLHGHIAEEDTYVCRDDGVPYLVDEDEMIQVVD